MPLVDKAVLAALAFAMLHLALVTDWQLKALALMVVLVSTVYWVLKMERERRRASALETAYQELDEQATLIVQTDYQLQNAQDELDKKLNGLYTLHALGRQVQVTFNLEQLFALVTPALVGALGFDRCLIGLFDPAHASLLWRLHLGFTPQQAKQLLAHLTDLKIRDLLAARTQPWIINQGQEHNDLERKLLQLLTLGTATLTPLSIQGELAGMLLLGNETAATKVTAGDAELLSVMAQQLSVAMENAHLYEELFQSRRDLEANIQERTRELGAANAALQRMNKAKSDFVSMVAHELRTPLTSVKGYASILRSGQLGPVAEPQAERLAKIEKSADHLAALINNLLDIARIESGRVAMNVSRVPTAPLMHRLQDLLRPQLAEQRLQLEVQTHDVAELPADAGQIERVFINLLSNALKYTPPEGRITVTFTRRPEDILVEVRDTGVGIAPDQLPHLFEEFYRAPNPINDGVKGTGLGLSLVRRIIEAHHGTIRAESEPGRGTRFVFTLPAAAPASDALPAERRPG